MLHSSKQYKLIISLILFCGLLYFNQQPVQAQQTPSNEVIFGHEETNVEPFYNKEVFQALDFRNIGPFRGGRALAISGVSNDPLVYYFGSTGGGVYKTVNGGNSWFNVSDGYFKTGSVGSLAISNSDPNVIYVGMGEDCIRGNMSTGDGLYKSTDAGKTWQWMGLGNTHIIGDIVIHPTNPDVVWVAALGETFGKDGNEARGVFKSTDGGKTWNKVLYKGPHVGAVELELDPNNPRIIYAALWETYRTPWSLSSGGDEEGGYQSGIYRSDDGGETWDYVSDNAGMPKGVLGKIGIAISPANSNRIWALIEADNGGLYRSDDAGETWRRVSNDARMSQRAWYYTHIAADPQNQNVVYVLNAPFLKSVDGGRTFSRMSTPHGDHHDLWIDPENPNRMAVADDGGGQVSLDGGKSWSSMMLYATPQFYHVITDNRFPYRVYGAQQDNSTVVIKNRTAGGGITIRDWHSVGGGESGFIAPDPNNPQITFAGSYGGLLTKHDSETEESENVAVWPNNPMGHGAIDLKFRFQWTFPIYISPLKPDVLYATSQYVHRSKDGGKSWERISEDLTRNEADKQEKSGGPITHDDTSIEYYNTIFSFGISPANTDVLWAGADDGLIHVSRDNGQSWDNVTPPALAAAENRARINSIEPSPFDAGKVYVAATRYKQGNFEPLLFKTDNYGDSWTKIINGIPPKDFTRAIAVDPLREGLLYVGTETGIYISFNDGGKWQRLQLNLPNVAITDLTVSRRDNDLVLASQGRAFYILDEISVFQQLSDDVAQSKAYLFDPEVAYQFGRSGGFFGGGDTEGQNPSRGPVVFYYLNGVDAEANVELQFLKGGDLIRTYSNKFTVEGDPVKSSGQYYDDGETENPSVLSDKQGLNSFVWNMRYPGVEIELEDEPVWWGGSTRGPEAVPGTYTVRLVINDETVQEQQFEIKSDPRETSTQEDLQAQFDLTQTVLSKLGSVFTGIKSLREAREKVVERIKNLPTNSPEREKLEQIKEALDQIELNLTQIKSESGQDPLNYPIKIDNKLAALAGTIMRGKTEPTKQQYAVYEDLAQKADKQLQLLDQVLNGELFKQIQEGGGDSNQLQNQIDN